MNASPLPEELGSTFSVGAARDAGVTPARLRAADLSKPFHGVRQVFHALDTAPEASLEQLMLNSALRYAHRMTDHEFFSHVAAAVIWGLPLPYWLLVGRLPDTAVLAPRRHTKARGVIGHSVKPGMAHVTVHPVYGVRVMTPASTWASLASLQHHLEDVVAVADAVVREPLHDEDPPALATLAQLEQAAGAGRRVGVWRLRAALPLVSTRSRSRPESWLRLTLLDAGLPEARVNFDVVEGGAWLGQVDLAYPELKVAVEYEGEHHLTDPVQWAEDIRRVERLTEAGWRVIRVTKSDLFEHPALLAARVRRALFLRAG